MNDFSLVPVDHQPDFEDISLLPVDHDPFSADGIMQQAQAGQAQSSAQSAQNQPAQPQPQARPQQLATQAGQPNAGAPANSARDGVAHPNDLAPSVSGIQVAADDGTPGNNQAQNAQVRAIQVELGLSEAQRQQLHREISGQGYGYQEIRQIAIDMFGK